MSAALPNWPRLMDVGLACRYVGWSESGFLTRVGETWPEPIRIGKKKLWDKKGLDRAVDRISLDAEPLTDPIMERIENAFGSGA